MDSENYAITDQLSWVELADLRVHKQWRGFYNYQFFSSAALIEAELWFFQVIVSQKYQNKMLPSLYLYWDTKDFLKEMRNPDLAA
uniref:Uncharacterized protein n=1 Tax=Rhizophagus irregularis (strain DAOM 181602 / DAOM 197198 / MUCL 43194) TaxID=747089 RepID=U9UB23_RHIID